MSPEEGELMRQWWIFRETLKEISRRDPCPSDNPNECNYVKGGVCMGCLARIALLRAIPINGGQESTCPTQAQLRESMN